MQRISLAGRRLRLHCFANRAWLGMAWLGFFLIGLICPVTALEAGDVTKKVVPAEQVASFTVPASSPPTTEAASADKPHPLLPALKIAEEALDSISANIDDYTCTLIRRERVAGKLGKHEFLKLKVRHEVEQEDEVIIPFSVYLHFEKPAKVAGREALYIAGKHGGKVFVRRGGQRSSYLSSYVKPDSRLAMRENRYPITDIGFKRMVERLINVIENDLKYDECEVNFYTGAKVNDRSCTRIEVIHPIEREHFRFQRAMVFVDDEDKLPIGYASFFWPEEPGGKPRLLEEYVYTDIKLNVGLADEDFDRDNPAYGFSTSRRRDSTSDE